MELELLRDCHVELELLRDCHVELELLRDCHVELELLRDCHVELELLRDCHVELEMLRDCQVVVSVHPLEHSTPSETRRWPPAQSDTSFPSSHQSPGHEKLLPHPSSGHICIPVQDLPCWSSRSRCRQTNRTVPPVRPVIAIEMCSPFRRFFGRHSPCLDSTPL